MYAQPPMTEPLHAESPQTLLHGKVIDRYFMDRDAGLYGSFTTGASEMYTDECSTLWKELRRDAKVITLVHIRATVKKSKAPEKAMKEELQLPSSAV